MCLFVADKSHGGVENAVQDEVKQPSLISKHYNAFA